MRAIRCLRPVAILYRMSRCSTTASPRLRAASKVMQNSVALRRATQGQPEWRDELFAGLAACAQSATPEKAAVYVAPTDDGEARRAIIVAATSTPPERARWLLLVLQIVSSPASGRNARGRKERDI